MSRNTNINRSKKKVKPGNVIFNICNYTFFIVFTILCIFPFYYLIINTISNNDLSSRGLVNLVPKGIHFKNFVEVFKIDGFLQSAWVSVSRTVIGAACTVLASAFLGFLFTQKKMWARRFWYRFMIITMYFNAGLIPMYIIMLNLKLTNNFLVYIIPLIVQPFNIILVKTFIESLPASLQEAAEIDGAGIMSVFLKIILPLTTPILATISIFSAVQQWNSFQDTMLYVSEKSLYALQYRVYTYINQANSIAMALKNADVSNSSIINLATQQTPTSVRMTITVITVIPILFIYPIFQKHFVKGMMIGAVKG